MQSNNLRPGVYSSYTVTSSFATPRSLKGVGLVAPLDSSLCGRVHWLERHQDAQELLGDAQDHQLVLLCCQLLFETGVSKIALSGIGASPLDAGKLLEQEEDLGIILPLIQEEEEFQQLQSTVLSASEQGRERLLVGGISYPASAIRIASRLNHQRSILVVGETSYQGTKHPIFGAAAFAGLIISSGDPRQNFNGQPLPWIQLTRELYEEEIQMLLKRGATPLETSGGVATTIRGVTTKTTTNGLDDSTFRSVNTPLLIDDVIVTVRRRLKSRLQGIGISKGDLESISTQVVLELEAKKKEGILSHYQMPLIRSHAHDPSICIVELRFTIAHILSQIHLVAEIQL